MKNRPKKGDIFESRRSGAIKYVLGFTRKGDGVERVRLQDDETGRITMHKVESLSKNYRVTLSPVAW